MEDIERKVHDWDDRMRSFPTFEELRDVEYVRRSGRINMITENVQRELYDRGRYAGVIWLERCKECHMSWTAHYDAAVSHYVSRHGPVDSWYPKSLVASWEQFEVDQEIQTLQSRLRDLEEKSRSRNS